MAQLSTCIEGFLLAKSAAGRSHYILRNYRKELASVSLAQPSPLSLLSGKRRKVVCLLKLLLRKLRKSL